MSSMVTGAICALAGVILGTVLPRPRRHRRAWPAKFCQQHGVFHRDNLDCPFCGEPLDYVNMFRTSPKAMVRSVSRRNPHRRHGDATE